MALWVCPRSSSQADVPVLAKIQKSSISSSKKKHSYMSKLLIFAHLPIIKIKH